MTNKIINRISRKTVILIVLFNFPMFAQISEEYSLFYSVPYFETRTMNPIYGSYYLEGIQANELMYSRLWTWKKDISETSDLVDGITPRSFKTMLIPPMDGSNLWSWKIKIRSNLKWPDGKPLTAEDVKFTFDVYGSDRTGSALKKWLDMIKDIKVIDNEIIQFFVEAENKRTVQYVIPLVQILPEHKVVTNYLLRDSQFSNEPIGSGPFQFVSQKKRKLTDKGDSKIVFEKNNHYYRWGKNKDGVKISNISSIKVIIERVVSSVITKLANENRSDDWSTLDLVLNVPNSPIDFQNLKSQGEHLTFEPYSSNSWYGIALNCEKPFLQNRDIRMALTYAGDIEQTINDRYTTVKKGGVDELVAHRISGPFNPLWGAGDGSLQPIKYDETEAKNLLDKSGVIGKKYKGNPVQLKLIYNSGRVIKGNPEELVIEDLVNDLKEIGIKVNTVALGAKAFADKLASGDYDMAFQYYELGYGGNIAPLFTTGDLQNICRFSDPLLTSYMDKFNRSSGVQKKEYGKRIHQIVYKEAPYIFLYRLDRIMAYRNELEVKNWIVPKYFFTHIGKWYFKD